MPLRGTGKSAGKPPICAGGLGASATNKQRRVYTGALLAKNLNIKIHASRLRRFLMFSLNTDIVLDLINHALRPRQMERFVADFNETEYAIFAVKVNEIFGV